LHTADSLTNIRSQSGFWQQLSQTNDDQEQKLTQYCTHDGYDTTLCSSLRTDGYTHDQLTEN